MRTVAVLSALPKESAALLELPGEAVTCSCGVTWAIRDVAGLRVVVAFGGMGAVNAAASAQFVIDRFHPEVLAFSGIAGSLNPHVGMGDVVVGAQLECLDADMGIIAESAPYLTSFASDVRLAHLAGQELVTQGFTRVASVREDARMQEAEEFGTLEPHAPRFVMGTIATSNLFSTNPATLTSIRRRYQADCEEMEGAGAAQVCARASIPFLAIRSISNVCGEAYDALDGREADLTATARLAADITLGAIRRLAQR